MTQRRNEVSLRGHIFLGRLIVLYEVPAYRWDEYFFGNSNVTEADDSVGLSETVFYPPVGRS